MPRLEKYLVIDNLDECDIPDDNYVFLYFQIMANYSEEEAAKCLAWIAMVMEGDPDVTFPASEAEVLSQGMAKHDAFGDILYNGKIICK